MAQMIELDGSFGEGGGALVRTALASSMLSQKPFKIKNIRSGRPKTGLKAQHLEAIKALKQLAPTTKTSPIELGTTEFWFHPGQIKTGQYTFDIKTAGSISLFLQAVLPPCLFAPSKVTLTIKGGTCGKWQASVDYLQSILLPNLQRFANKLTLSVTKRGYYPKGGGEIVLEITPKFKLKEFSDIQSLISKISTGVRKFDFTSQGKLEYVKGFVNSSRNLSDVEVARRVEAAATTSFRNLRIPVSIDKGYFPALSTGGEFLLWTVHSKNGDINPTNCIRLASSMLIEKGVSSEEIGQGVAKKLKQLIDSGAAVDHYLADQLLIYMALLPNSSIVTNDITKHSTTNVHVLEQFLRTSFVVNEKNNRITSKKGTLKVQQTTLSLVQNEPKMTKVPSETKGVKIGNWTQVSSEKIHSGKIFDTYFDEVINPNGNKGEYTYIKVMDGVCILPIDKENNVYLIKEYRYPIQDYNIELIGGGLEKGESKLEAAKRELQEEAGIVATEFIELGSLEIDPSTGPHVDSYFIAKNLSFREDNQDDDEEIELLKIPFDQAIEWCMNGKINNVETIAILFKAREFLKNSQ